MATPATTTSDPTTEKPLRQRRWIPLSLKMFVAILVLLGVTGVLWIGVPAYRHHVASREIERCNGYVWLYGRQQDWQTRWFGENLMADFTEVYAVFGNVPDEEKPPFDDDTMRYVRDFGSVTCLILSGSRVTDAGLQHLSGMTGLYELDVDGLSISDTGIANVRNMTDLGDLNISNTAVTDAGLKHLRGLTKLRKLSLWGTAISDEGLENLSGLSALEHLELSHTGLTDVGLNHVKGMQHLQTLFLDSTGITDAGMTELSELPDLRELYIRDTNVTIHGIVALRTANPNLKIVTENWKPPPGSRPWPHPDLPAFTTPL